MADFNIDDLTNQLQSNCVIEEKNGKDDKFLQGEDARKVWAKCLPKDDVEMIKVDEFNDKCNNQFVKVGTIVLDENIDCNTTIKVKVKNNELWGKPSENIYLIVRDEYIMKIGGTRDGMSGRWNSYKCGHCVQQRKNKKGVHYPGKMSVTNAYLYHTIEKDLLDNQSVWEIYVWNLPPMYVTQEILGTQVKIKTQTFHAYESCCITKFKELTGQIPFLCNNCDPQYVNVKC